VTFYPLNYRTRGPNRLTYVVYYVIMEGEMNPGEEERRQ
jgi:hypothetical protein